MAIVEVTTRIAAPVERCFDLARSIDLHVRSTSGTSESAVAGVTKGLIADGEQVTFRGRHFGMWREMTSRITAFHPPRHFRDSMVSGPFERFDHDHFFEPDPAGTVMIDRFDFIFRRGLLGRLIERLLLERHFERFVTTRNQFLKGIAESGQWREFVPTSGT
jgi:ligand-binding SRPBCC domain-containing protein